jgi:hypothetical protein
MRYRTSAALHVRALRILAGVRRATQGQGTVEYVALILLVAGVLATVVAAAGSFGGKDIGQTIVTKLKEAIDSAGGASGG